MKYVKTHLPKGNNAVNTKLYLLKGALLSPLYWMASHYHSAPGLYLHYHAFALGLRLLLSGNLPRSLAYKMMFSPMDSVRYFEFDFMWKAIEKSTTIGCHLDISSPRLFTILLLDKYPDHSVIMVNPDKSDLDLSKNMILACGFSERCILHDHQISELTFSSSSFDTVTSISVLEHIPRDNDLNAIKHIWNLLKIGGRLLLSVPCARESIEEYIDLNEYGLLEPDKDNFVFGQRFYDENLLTERIFFITGRPFRSMVFGEKKPGIFLADREKKVSSGEYPFWKEPYLTGRDYMFFDSIQELPGLGVIAMEFIKS